MVHPSIRVFQNWQQSPTSQQQKSSNSGLKSIKLHLTLDELFAYFLHHKCCIKLRTVYFTFSSSRKLSSDRMLALIWFGPKKVTTTDKNWANKALFRTLSRRQAELIPHHQSFCIFFSMFYTVYTWTIYPFHMKNVLFTMEKWKQTENWTKKRLNYVSYVDVIT